MGRTAMRGQLHLNLLPLAALQYRGESDVYEYRVSVVIGHSHV